MEDATFKNVDNNVIKLLTEFFNALKLKTVGYAPARFLGETLFDLDNFPKVPKKNTVVSFKYENTNYTIVYSNYKIELSDYTTVNEGNGYDAFQSYNFGYDTEQKINHDGDLDTFRLLLLDALNNVAVTDISISEEE